MRTPLAVNGSASRRYLETTFATASRPRWLACACRNRGASQNRLLGTLCLAAAIAWADAVPASSQATDCSNPPIPWENIRKSFWEQGYAVLTPCKFAGENALLDALHDYTVAGCAWAEASKAGKNFPQRIGQDAKCYRKSNKWKTESSVHAAAVSEETRRMLAHIHDTNEWPVPYQTVTRVQSAVIRAHSDVIFWDTVPRARTVGTWLALEDIHPDSGPLEIYPESHRMSLWDSYELGLPSTSPNAAKAIDKAIGSKTPQSHNFLQSRPHAAISVPAEELVKKRQPCKDRTVVGKDQCTYYDAVETVLSNRTTHVPNLKRGQMLLWAASLVHLSKPPRNESLTRSSFISHYVWPSKAYWQPWLSQKKITYVTAADMLKIPLAPFGPWRKNETMPETAPKHHAPTRGRAAVQKPTPAKSVTPANLADVDSEAAPPVAANVVAANQAARRSVFIVGASRGVGLGLVKVYAASGYTVHATTRTLHTPGELGKVPGLVTLHQLDVLVPSDIAALRQKADTGALGAIGTIVHNAAVKNNNLTHNMLVNSVAPYEVAEALRLALLRSEEKKLCIITSDMGSEEVMMHQKPQRQKWPYTISKKAANKQFRDHEPGWRAQGITAVAMHPGYVKTRMSNGMGELTPLESAAAIKRTLEKATQSDAGRFFRWDGQPLPW